MGLKKKALGLLAFLLLCLCGYELGPRVPEVKVSQEMPPTDITIHNVQDWVARHESSELIRPNNHAVLHWADSAQKQTTDFALVYLHGFSASRGEGDPIHLDFANRYGMNAFLARLDQHGLEDPEPLLHMTPASLLQSAKEAILVGNAIGRKVIVMSCSTGSTLALYLAAHHPDKIHGLICYSPNVDLANQATHLLDGPWGLQLIRWVEGGDYHQWEAPPAAEAYWYTSYRVEALVALRHLVDQTMVEETFSKINQPLLTLYYYKSDEQRDETVSIDAITEMYEHVSTPKTKKMIRAVPNAGFHVISSKYFSGDLETVWQYTTLFAENILQLDTVLAAGTVN